MEKLRDGQVTHLDEMHQRTFTRGLRFGFFYAEAWQERKKSGLSHMSWAFTIPSVAQIFDLLFAIAHIVARA